MVDPKELQEEMSRLLEEMTATSPEVGAHAPAFEPLSDSPHERLELPGIPEDMVEMSDAMSGMLKSQQFAMPDVTRPTRRPASYPEIPEYSPSAPVYRGSRASSGSSGAYPDLDLSDANPAMAFDAGAVPGDERNQGRYYPEHDSVQGLQGMANGMQDYHQRLMEVMDTIQRILLEGVADFDRLNANYNRLR